MLLLGLQLPVSSYNLLAKTTSLPVPNRERMQRAVCCLQNPTGSKKSMSVHPKLETSVYMKKVSKGGGGCATVEFWLCRQKRLDFPLKGGNKLSRFVH